MHEFNQSIHFVKDHPGNIINDMVVWEKNNSKTFP